VTRISVAHKHRTKPDHPNNSINQLSTKQPFLSSKKKEQLYTKHTNVNPFTGQMQIVGAWQLVLAHRVGGGSKA